MYWCPKIPQVDLSPQDTLSLISLSRPRLTQELNTKLQSFQSAFEKLLKVQGEALQMEHEPSQPET